MIIGSPGIYLKSPLHGAIFNGAVIIINSVSMAMDLSILLEAAPQLFRDLPFIINLVQLIFYTGLILTFGGFVMRGYSGHISGTAKFIGKLVFGFLTVITGIGISWLIPNFVNIKIYEIFQTVFLNIILGGAIATVVMYISLKMISHNIFNVRGIERTIKRLQNLHKKAKEVEKKEKQSHRHGIRHPVRITGALLLISFLAIGIGGFRGFSNPIEELGFSQDDLETMAEQLDTINQEYGDRISEISDMTACMGAIDLLEDQEAFSNASTYNNPDAELMIENYTGESVTSMFSIQSSGGFFIFSLTDTRTCISTLDTVCICKDN